MEARVLRPVRRMMSSGGGGGGDSDVELLLPGLGTGGAAAAVVSADEEGVLEAVAQAVSPEEERRARQAAEGQGARIGRLLLTGTIRALDVTLLGLEFLAAEALPAVAARARVAGRRAADAVMPVRIAAGGVSGGVAAVVGGERGVKGKRRDLLPVFERPMRSDLMSTRRR